MVRRRLTALLVGVLLLPSTVTGGGSECTMRSVSAHGEHASVARDKPGHESHPTSHHDAGPVAASADQTEAPAPLPGSPLECVASACATAGIVAPTLVVVDPADVGEPIVLPATLVPDSPVPGLEPPPPRA